MKKKHFIGSSVISYLWVFGLMDPLVDFTLRILGGILCGYYWNKKNDTHYIYIMPINDVILFLKWISTLRLHNSLSGLITLSKKNLISHERFMLKNWRKRITVCQATSSRKKAKNNREPSRRLPEKRRRRRRICISFGLGPWEA